MRDYIFSKVILPVCGNEDNSFMGITTLDGMQNWVSGLKLLKRKDGDPILKSLHHGPCDSCVERGEGEKCPHYERMPWKSKVEFVYMHVRLSHMCACALAMEHKQSKDDDIREIYKQRGQAELGTQEMSGTMISPLTFIVRATYIRQLQERPHYIFNHAPSVIHVAIDPHGGGKTSRTCIMFLANENGRIVVRACNTMNAYP